MPIKAPSCEAKRPAPKAQDRVPRRGTTLRSGVKDDVRLSSFLRIMRAEVEGAFLQTGKPGARERRKRKHQGVVYVRAHVCIWRQCNKDPSASLGMTIRKVNQLLSIFIPL